MNPIFTSTHFQRIRARFQRLYGDKADACLDRLQMLIGRYGVGYTPGNYSPASYRERWSEKDSVLITYGNSVHQTGQNPLVTLGRFLVERLKGVMSTVHILPFFPYSMESLHIL